MTMKKKLFTIALALCMVLTMVPGGVSHSEAAWAETHTSHPVCGATCSHTGGDTHSSVTFDKWLASDYGTDASTLVLCAGDSTHTYGDTLKKMTTIGFCLRASII